MRASMLFSGGKESLIIYLCMFSTHHSCRDFDSEPTANASVDAEECAAERV